MTKNETDSNESEDNEEDMGVDLDDDIQDEEEEKNWINNVWDIITGLIVNDYV